MTPALEAVLGTLLAASEDSRVVTLDQIGDAVGTLAVSVADVDGLIGALESAGRRVEGPKGARGVANLRKILPEVRALTQALGRKPTITELAARTGLSEADVRHALALGNVMGR